MYMCMCMYSRVDLTTQLQKSPAIVYRTTESVAYVFQTAISASPTYPTTTHKHLNVLPSHFPFILQRYYPLPRFSNPKYHELRVQSRWFSGGRQASARVGCVLRIRRCPRAVPEFECAAGDLSLHLSGNVSRAVLLSWSREHVHERARGSFYLRYLQKIVILRWAMTGVLYILRTCKSLCGARGVQLY